MVITVMESGRILEELSIPLCKATEACSQIAMLQKKWFPNGQCVFAVDCDGLGGPYLDILRQMISNQLECKFLEIHGSGTSKEATGKDYQNLRAEIAFYVKAEMEAGNVCLDNDPRAREEAISEQYFINVRGRLQIEDKEDIKERIGRSPDRWDARKLAIWGLKHAERIRPKSRWDDDEPGLIQPRSFMSA